MFWCAGPGASLIVLDFPLLGLLSDSGVRCCRKKLFEERRQMRRRNCAYLDVLFYELELGKNQMTGKCNTAKS